MSRVRAKLPGSQRSEHDFRVWAIQQFGPPNPRHVPAYRLRKAYHEQCRRIGVKVGHSADEDRLAVLRGNIDEEFCKNAIGLCYELVSGTALTRDEVALLTERFGDASVRYALRNAEPHGKHRGDWDPARIKGLGALGLRLWLISDEFCRPWCDLLPPPADVGVVDRARLLRIASRVLVQAGSGSTR